MCSIIGYFNQVNSLEKTINSLEKIKYRSPNGFGIYTNNEITTTQTIKELKTNLSHSQSPNKTFALGHGLFNLVNDIPQPLTNKENNSIFITNCEIYNWTELNKKYKLNAKNDADLLFKLLELKNNLKEVLEELDGVYAFVYLKDNELILTRDLLGVKPLFYYNQNEEFSFASEKKALEVKNTENIKELNPKTILKYNIKTKKIDFENKKFYSLGIEHKEEYVQLKEKTKELLINAIKKRIPKNNTQESKILGTKGKHKIGVLFSGGIDSTFIVYILKKLNIPFTCYTAKLEGGNIEEAEDYIYAKEIAKKYDLELKVAKIKTDKLEPEVKEIIQIIEDNDYIKVSVALPFHISLKEAKKDNIQIIFSGLGSEEIFAGYKRHKKADNPNEECVEGLKILHIRDLYRDDVLSMSQTIEMRLPFLDKELIKYSLNIPIKYKLNLEENRSKIILREIAQDLGLETRYTERQKKAAQYGSKFDKGLLRLAKDSGLGKQEFLDKLNNSLSFKKLK